MKRQIFFPIIIGSLLFFYLLLPQISYSQGWGFSFQVIVSGNCTAYLTRSFPTNGFPTQMQCERARQMVAAIKSATYGCTARIECAPCSGSDITSSSGIDLNGKPVFVTHESEAFKEWSSEYKQVLASYNVNSILGKGIIKNTDFSSYENLYVSLVSDYKFPPLPPPKVTPPPVATNANEVDLSNKKGVVQLLTTPEEQKKRDEFYQGQLQNQGYDNLTQMDANNPAIVDPAVEPKNNISNASIAEGVTDAIGDLIGMAVTTLVPKAELPNFIQGFGQNLAQATPSNIQNGLNAISGTASPSSVKDPATLVNTSYIGTCTLCKWILTPVLK
jgi:hypothetical protein